MKTLRCKLTFQNGERIVAEACASRASQDVTVSYSGQLQHLQPCCEKGSLDFIEWFLRARAQQLGASLDVESTGDFDK